MSNQQLNSIRDSKPDLCLVAMGSPKQDELIQRLCHTLHHGIAIGIGGVFDIWAGQFKRSPKFIQAIGLEWLYRLIQSPKKIPVFLRAIQWLFKPIH